MDADDLTGFEDYLSELSSAIYFDSEKCPICRIILSDSISINQVPLIELEFENETIAAHAISKLEEKEIQSNDLHQVKKRFYSRNRNRKMLNQFFIHNYFKSTIFFVETNSPACLLIGTADIV